MWNQFLKPFLWREGLRVKMLCLFLQRQCPRSTRMRWSPSTNKPDNKSVGSSITSCHQSTARTKTRKFTTGDISWKSALTSRLISFTIREKECNCLCAKPNKTPIRLLAYKTGAIFLRVFQAYETRSGHPFPRRACLTRISGSPLTAWNASLRWPKKCEKKTPVLQAIREQITDSNPFGLWLKKRKTNRFAQTKRELLPPQNGV